MNRDAFDLLDMFAELEQHDNVSYVLSKDLRILRTNAAWRRFALANGGESFLARWKHGSSLLDVIPDELKPFYRQSFARATEADERWDHDYECSSPELFRKYRMIVYPFGGSFVVTHALLVEGPHRVAHDPGKHYETQGVIAMCSHCRRVRCTSELERWDFVPSYLAPGYTKVSHTLCPPCWRYYYE